MSVKRKVGRPKKTSTPIVKAKKYISWKEKYEQLLAETQLREQSSEMFMKSAHEVVQEQADNQLEMVKLVLDGYSTIENHCKTTVELTGSIELEDVIYLTSVARRALLHKFTVFNSQQED